MSGTWADIINVLALVVAAATLVFTVLMYVDNHKKK